MREIKFRLFHRGRMHYNYFSLSSKGNLSWTSITGLMEGEHPEAIMQYTGLKDKNGKEIWEGDIIIPVDMHDANIDFWSNGKGRPQEVCWHNFAWDFPTWIPDIKQNWKVIGNIYENPELLKVSNK